MESTSKDNFKKFFKEYFPYIGIIVFVILIKQFVMSPIIVNGESMMKTLHDKDVMILDRISYRVSDIDRFDIVVVDEGSEYIIKRVIGLPGEEVSCEDGKLFVNGKEIKDSYGIGLTDDFVFEVPKGEYFVLGDNRENSMDSRYFGSFKKEDILGKTKLVLFPLDRFGDKK
ncbi:MAG: signal peptidase I [Bacilli bacterium]|nr:signal peptidase I [Bacilli bacterium]